jgi:hypothetical protein
LEVAMGGVVQVRAVYVRILGSSKSLVELCLRLCLRLLLQGEVMLTEGSLVEGLL